MTEICSGAEAVWRIAFPLSFRRKKTNQTKKTNRKGRGKEQTHLLYSLIKNPGFVVTLNYDSI